MKKQQQQPQKKQPSVPKPAPKVWKLDAPLRQNSKTPTTIKVSPPLKASLGTEKTKNEKMEINEASHGLTKHKKEKEEKHSSVRYVDTLSPYAKAMISPFEYGPAQIPDANTFPSACLRLTQKFSLTATTNSTNTGLGNSFAICLGSAYSNTATPAPNNASGYKGGNIVPQISTWLGALNYWRTFGCFGSGISNTGFLFSGGGAITPLMNTAFGDSYDPSTRISSGYVSDIDLYRPVSAAVKVTAIGPMLSRSGVFVGASFPRGGIMDDQDFTTCKFDRVMNHPTAQLLPVNSGRALEVHYSPTDNVNYEYMDASNQPDDLSAQFQMNRGELWIIGYGLQTGETILIETTVGMEFIPKTAVLEFVDVNPSFSHTRQMDQAENLSAIVPKVMQSDMTDTDVLDAQALMATPGTPQSRPPKTLTLHTGYSSFGILLKKEKGSKKMNTKVGQFVHDGLSDAKSVVKKGRSLLSEIISSVSDVMKFV